MNRWLSFLSRHSPTSVALARESLRYRGRVAVYLVLLFIGAGLTSYKFLLLKGLVQAGLDAERENIALMLSATVGCWLASHLIVYLASLAGIRLERDVAVDLVKRMLVGLVERPSSSLRQVNSNYAVHYLRNGLATVCRALRSLLTGLTHAVIALFTIGAAFAIQPVLAVVCLVIAVLVVWWTARHIHQQRRGMTESFTGARQIQNRLVRMVESLPQIKLYGAGDEQLARLAAPIQAQRSGEQLALLAQRRAALELNLVAAVAGLLLVGMGAVLMHWRIGDIADLATLLVLNQTVFQGLRQMLVSWTSVEENADYLALLFAAPGNDNASEPAPARLPGPIESLECRDAVFAVGDAALLSGANCRLEPGRLYGVAGPSGSGKTMLLHLLSGRSQPHAGRLLVNGIDVQDLPYGDLCRRIALATWPPTVLKGTLAHNLRAARPNASDDELRAVLERVAFGKDLAQLAPVGGLNADIGRKGVHLSVGQLQRMSLARALLREPEVLLLDDLLTGLDPESSGRVLDSLRDFARERIVVLVAPTPEALRHCDEVLLTRAGRFVAQTTPAEALANHLQKTIAGTAA